MGAKKKAVPATVAVAAAAAPPSDVVAACHQNAAWLAEVQQAINVIVGKFGADIMTAPPLSIADGGYLAPYDEPQFNVSSGEYFCGVNIFSAQPLMSLTPNVPIMDIAVKELKPDMPTMSPSIHVAATGRNTSPLLRVSPEEPVHAVLLRIAERIGQTCSDEELSGWRSTLLSWPCKFVKGLDTDDSRYFYNLNLRESAKMTAKAIGHTASQVIIDIYMFKVRKEAASGPLSAAAVAKLYQDNVRFSDSKEARSSGLVDAAITVFQRLFSFPELSRIVVSLEKARRNQLFHVFVVATAKPVFSCLRLPVKSCVEELHLDSPFNSVWKLNELVSKCRTTDKLRWVVATVRDLVHAGALEAGEFTIKTIRSTGGKARCSCAWRCFAANALVDVACTCEQPFGSGVCCCCCCVAVLLLVPLPMLSVSM
jgi:hypothetical protein